MTRRYLAGIACTLFIVVVVTACQSSSDNNRCVAAGGRCTEADYCDGTGEQHALFPEGEDCPAAPTAPSGSHGSCCVSGSSGNETACLARHGQCAPAGQSCPQGTSAAPEGCADPLQEGPGVACCRPVTDAGIGDAAADADASDSGDAADAGDASD